MDNQKKSSKFGLGLLFGTIVGGLAAIFFNPQTGKENREAVAKKIKEWEKILEEGKVDEKVRAIFGELTEETKTIFLKAKKEVIHRLADLKEAFGEIDKEKYVKIVEEAVDILKKEGKKELKEMEKLRSVLIDDWQKIVEHKKKNIK